MLKKQLLFIIFKRRDDLQQQSPNSNVFLLQAKKINTITMSAIPAGNKAIKNGKSLFDSGATVVVLDGASVTLNT